jgi:hypothetical protein
MKPNANLTVGFFSFENDFHSPSFPFFLKKMAARGGRGGKMIRTSDFSFIRCGHRPIELPLRSSLGLVVSLFHTSKNKLTTNHQNRSFIFVLETCFILCLKIMVNLEE